jgi:hypothetical protein
MTATAVDALTVPAITDNMSNLEASLAYANAGANAGWYVGPAERGSKHPGSVLGKNWQHKTSRDPQMLISWFAGTDHGVFLHAGRSGAIIFDVDHPDRLPAPIRQAIAQYAPPYQSTRHDHPGRGHYVFAVPEGRRLSNSLGELAGGWGELRGENGVIIVAPSVHKEDGGRYQWLHTGPVPTLPGYLASRLPEATEAADAATDAQVAAFLTEYRQSARPELLDIQLHAWQKKVRAGASRHSTVMGHLAGAMKEARAGLVDAQLVADTFQSVFEPAVMADPIGPDQGKPRSLAEARSEWAGILAWAVAQGLASDPAETRARVEREVPSDPFAGPKAPRAETNGSTNGSATPPPQPADSSSLILPESFYEERQVLQAIRSYAHSRGAAADPVLYAVLARLSAMTPRECRLDTGIGRGIGASLNLFVAAVGPSGGGKSSSAGVSKDLFRAPFALAFRDDLPIGSGEGLIEAYMGWVFIDDPSGAVTAQGDPKQVKVKTQVVTNAFFVADEGEVFTKMQERSGATIGPIIRSAWYGQTIGQQNADQDRRRVLAEGSYAMGMLVGFQPETVLPLLNDEAAGTPQRFVSCWTVDPTVPKTQNPFTGPVSPEEFRVSPAMMSLAEAVRAEIWDHHISRVAGDLAVPRLDAHANLTKAKLAALLTLLEKRYNVTEDDWRLAGIMWETSSRVRDELLRLGQLTVAREKASRTRDYVEREGMAEGARQQVRDASAKVVRLARLVGRYVHDPKKPSRTVADATRRLRSKDRHLATDAIDYAASAGWVIHDGASLEPGESMPSEAGH